MTPAPPDLARLAAVYSRTFGVCALCPPGQRARAATWTDDVDGVGLLGVCDQCAGRTT